MIHFVLRLLTFIVPASLVLFALILIPQGYWRMLGTGLVASGGVGPHTLLAAMGTFLHIWMDAKLEGRSIF